MERRKWWITKRNVDDRAGRQRDGVMKAMRNKKEEGGKG